MAISKVALVHLFLSDTKVFPVWSLFVSLDELAELNQNQSNISECKALWVNTKACNMHDMSVLKTSLPRHRSHDTLC